MTQNLRLKVHNLIEEKALEIVGQIEAEMRANAPVYTGKLITTIRTDRVGKWKWFIGPHTDYNYFAEYGNHANHPDGYIHKKNPHGMKWVDNQGRVHFAQKVRPHKGSRFVEKTASKYK